MEEPMLEVCRISDPRYQAIRDRHYVENRGTHGQQIHFLVWYGGSIVGIISGASSVFGVEVRDRYFGINKENRYLFLPAIVNNTVFRLEYHEPNLATRVLSKWRRVVTTLWNQLYGVPVVGFETFVVETDTRKGSLYKADNWTYVGQTKGNTKQHGKGGLATSFERRATSQKLVFCRWVGTKPLSPTTEYVSSWRAQTTEEIERRNRLAQMRRALYGTTY